MSKILNVERANAITAHKKAGKEGKELLEHLFGKETFHFDPFESLKTFQDVCDFMGKDASDYALPDVSTEEITEEQAEQVAEIYRKRLRLVAKAFNGDWKPDISNTSQYKYYPYFLVEKYSSAPGGFRLSFSDYYCDLGCTLVSARPYFKDSKTAIHVGKLFTAEYEGASRYENLCL